MNRCHMMGTLMEEAASLQDIIEYFHRMEAQVEDPKKRNGCMLCNTAIEMAQFDEDAKKQVQEIFSELKKFFKKAIKNAIAKGELSNNSDPNKLADYLVGLMMGAAMMTRSPIERSKIKNYVETGLQVLQAKKP